MKLCMACMAEIGDNVTICPYCGYTGTEKQVYSLLPGTILGGRYIAGCALEYNGYAVKYIGMDAERKRKVIISEYLPKKLSARIEGKKGITIYSGSAARQFESGLLDFLNRGNLISNLKNIAGLDKVYDCIAENETGYIISEYLEGKSLQHMLDKGTKFTVINAKGIIEVILNALEALHKSGIIHYGISPDTIFILGDGSAKLIDAGMAGHIELKPGYAAPEQYNNGNCGTWTDVYSAGSLMYRMVTGTSLPEASERILNDNIKLPSSFVKNIPKSIENALLNSINIMPEKRTATAELFLNELNSSNTARRNTGKKKKEPGSIPLWVKITAAAFACVILAGGVMLYKASQKENNLKIEEKADRKFSTCINKPYAEFIKNWKEYDFTEDMLNVEFRYDTSVSEDTVKEFEDYTRSGCMVDGASLKNINKDKYVKKGGILAKIVVASSDKYTFLPEWKDNVPTKAKDTATYDQKTFCGKINVSNDTSEPYGIVKKITVDGKKVSPENISSPLYIKDNGENKKNNVVITIYSGSYYVMDANKKHKQAYYKGQNISDIKFKLIDKDGNQSYATLTDDTYKVKYDKNYISFNGSNEGTIIDVLSRKLKYGNKYDERKEPGVKLFDTVDIKFDYMEVTVKELSQYCKITNKDSYNNDDLVTDVDKQIFKKGDEVKITAVPKPTPTPKPTPEPTQKPVSVPAQEPTQKPVPKVTPAPEPVQKPASDTKKTETNEINQEETDKHEIN